MNMPLTHLVNAITLTPYRCVNTNISDDLKLNESQRETKLVTTKTKLKFTIMTDRLWRPTCWIKVNGVYHDVSNLCSVNGVPRGQSGVYSALPRSRQTPVKRKASPYNLYTAAIKDIPDSRREQQLYQRGSKSNFELLVAKESLHRRIGAVCDDRQSPFQVIENHDELSLIDGESFYSEEDDERRDDVGLQSGGEASILFRGAEETWQAFQSGRFTMSTCLDCHQHSISVEDAAYVVCAHCRLVYPLSSTTNTSIRQAGIGMGFKQTWCFSLMKEEALGDDFNST